MCRGAYPQSAGKAERRGGVAEEGMSTLSKKVKAGLISGILIALLAVFIFAIVNPSVSVVF